MVEVQLRQALVDAGRELARQGMVPGAAGNLSAKVEDGRFLITPSGARKGSLQPSDLLLIDTQGHVLDGSGRPSAESAMHLAAYQRYPWVQSVVHAHPVKASVLSAAHMSIRVDVLPEALIAMGDIATVPFVPSGTSALGNAVAEALADADAALLLNHGAITIGRSVSAALSKMEIVEALADITIQLHVLGRAVPLPTDEIDRLRTIWRRRRLGGTLS